MEKKIKDIAVNNFNINLKTEQLDAIQSYCSGTHTLLVAPTSFGKSIVYQIAPFLYDEERYQSSCSNKATTTATTTTTTQWSSSDEQQSTSSSTGSLTQAAPDTSTPIRPEEMDVTETGHHSAASASDNIMDDLSTDLSGLSINITAITRPITTTTQEVQVSHTSPATTAQQSNSSVSPKMFAQFLIIVPLVALIADAMDKLKKLVPNISVVHLTAATIQHAKSAVYIFTSPESIIDGTGRCLVQSGLNIKAVFIDEFHIIKSWGEGSGSTKAFRAAYGKLGELRALLPTIPFIGLSATATQETISAVTSSLHLTEPRIIKVSINKANITYHKIKVTGSVTRDFKWLSTLIKNSAASALPRIMIFFSNVNRLIDAYQYVTVYGNQPIGAEAPQIVMFHLITDPVIKQRVIDDLGKMDGVVRCVFCTSSLSMGMNLANITYVLHYGITTTADAFLQETGRAAREAGSHGHSILMHFTRMATGRKLDDTMKQYGKENASTCLRQVLLTKFHCEKPDQQADCCDECEPEVTCPLKSQIIDSFDSSITDSFSDSLSIGSVSDVEELESD